MVGTFSSLSGKGKKAPRLSFWKGIVETSGQRVMTCMSGSSAILGPRALREPIVAWDRRI